MTFLTIYLLIGFPLSMWALIEDNYGCYSEEPPHIDASEMFMDLFVGLLMTPFWPIFVWIYLMPNFVLKMYTKLVMKIISKKSDPTA